MSSTSEQYRRIDGGQIKREAERLYYEEGLTLAEVGERFGVSRERVRQWLVELGHDQTRHLVPRAQKERREEERQARIEACRGQVERRYRAGDSTAKIAADLILPEALVREALAQIEGLEKKILSSKRRRGPHPPVPNEQLLADLRAAAEDLGPHLTYSGFADWARARGLTGPQTYFGRFGSWREARRLAGLPPVRGPKRPRPDRISLSECVEAVRAVWDELGRPPSVSEYEQAARAGGLPSTATVRSRAGGWTDALLMADGLRGLDW